MFVFVKDKQVISYILFESSDQTKHDIAFDGGFNRQYDTPNKPFYTPEDYVFADRIYDNSGNFSLRLYDYKSKQEFEESIREAKNSK